MKIFLMSRKNVKKFVVILQKFEFFVFGSELRKNNQNPKKKKFNRRII